MPSIATISTAIRAKPLPRPDSLRRRQARRHQGHYRLRNGFHKHSCNTAIVFAVNDQKDLFEKQMQVGNHFVMVYGDFTRELEGLGKSWESKS